MNAWQRVMQTLQKAPVDRVPVFAVLGSYGGKLAGIDLKTLYSDAAAWVTGQQKAQDRFGFDLVLSVFDYSTIAEAFGSQVAWFDDQPPNMKRPAVQTAAEALCLALPDPEKSSRLPFVLEATRRLAAQYQGTVPVFGILPGPGILPSLLIGLENWIETVLFDQPTALKLLEHTGRFYVNWGNALLQAGADCLVVTEGMAAAEIAPRSLFADLFLPHLQQTFNVINGPKVLHQTGGRINPVLDLLPGLPGLAGVAIGSKDDLTEARQLLGPDLTIIGNLDNLSIPTTSPEKLYQISRACLRTAAPCGPFILSTSGADVPLASSAQQLEALLTASRDYAAEAAGSGS